MRPHELDIGPLIRRINEGIKKKTDDKLQDMNLTTAQAHVLGFLRFRREHGMITTQKDLEDHLKVSHPTVVGIIKRLEEKGYLYTEQDANDRRMKNLYLTELEDAVFDEMERRRERIETSLVDGMDDGEVQQLRSMLQTIMTNIERMEETHD